MQTIPAADVLIPEDRQRQFFDETALVELSTSIKGLGLMQAIVLRNDRRTLVAGERRLRAIQRFVAPLGFTYHHNGQPVPPGHVPYVTLAELGPLALEEAELDENLKRKDLTWQELAAAQARLHSLRQRQAAAKGETHTVTDTAKELLRVDHTPQGSDRQDIAKGIILAKYLDDPDVAKAKSVREAYKVLERKVETQRHANLAIEVGKTFTSKIHRAYHCDCVEWMRNCIEQTEDRFDVILTDPPYGMGADNFGDGAGRLATIEHHYDDSYEAWQSLMQAWTPLTYQITKPKAHAYIFCDIDRFHELKEFMKIAGWYVFRTPLINVKTNSGRVPLPDEGPRRQYEICLYAIKGHKYTTGLYSDVITSLADEQMGHGAQKPVSLYVDLLRRSVAPGDAVLDAFAGSGTIFPAAHQLKVIATGLEQNAASYGKCLERLNAL